MHTPGAPLLGDAQRARYGGCRGAAPFENPVGMYARERHHGPSAIEFDTFGVRIKYAQQPLRAVPVRSKQAEWIVLAGGDKPREIRGWRGDIHGGDSGRHAPVPLL